MNLDRFRGPHYAALLSKARTELENRDGEPQGTFTLKGLTEQEVAHLQGLLGTAPTSRPDRVKVDLARLDTVLRNGYGIGLFELLETLGPALRLKSRVQEEERRLRAQVLAPALASPLYRTDWFRAWLDDRRTRSAITQRVNRADTDGLGHAVRVLEAIEAHDTDSAPLLLPHLAVQVTGDTKALDHGRPLATLVQSALAERSGRERPEGAEERRALWEEHDVVQDDLASRVLVLNLPAHGDVLGAWMREAAEHGVPLQVTLHQLVRFPPRPIARVIHVCENPAVLRQAAEDLGPRAAPLLCTEGWPSAAFHRLATAARTAGAHLRYHGDFDWPGMAMTLRMTERYGARPWRMSAADYLAHPCAERHRLEGNARPTPWDPDLATAMRERGHAVFEESLMRTLLEDLRVQPPHRAPTTGHGNNVVVRPE